jgi:hypothetical protein
LLCALTSIAVVACVPDPVKKQTGGAAGAPGGVVTGGGQMGGAGDSGNAGNSSGAGDSGNAGSSGGDQMGSAGNSSGSQMGSAGDSGGAGSSGVAGDSGGAGSSGAAGAPAATGAAGTTGAAGATDAGAGGQGATDAGDDTGSGSPLDPCARTSWTFTPSVVCTTACAGMADAQKLPANAIDGNMSTRWTTGLDQGSKGQESVVLTFPSPVTLTGINLYAKAATDFPVAYLVEYATDGTTFLGFTPPLAGAGTTQLAIAFPQPTSLRAVRVTQTGKGMHWWSINELTVTGCTAP